MLKPRRDKIRQILKNLRSEAGGELAEAVTSFHRFPDAPVKPVILTLKKATDPQNREFAAYFLITLILYYGVMPSYRSKYRKRRRLKHFYLIKSNYKNIEKIINALVDAVNNDENEFVRAQALETLGMSDTALEHKPKLIAKVEKTVVDALSDESAEVRFWACYAAGQLKMKAALLKLQDLVENDKSPARMWYVAEEAADAIEWINDRDTEPRVLLSERNAENKNAEN